MSKKYRIVPVFSGSLRIFTMIFFKQTPTRQRHRSSHMGFIFIPIQRIGKFNQYLCALLRRSGYALCLPKCNEGRESTVRRSKTRRRIKGHLFRVMPPAYFFNFFYIFRALFLG